VREALARADADLERLATCLSRSGRLEGAALVVVGDHGSLPVHSALAPNTLLEQAGLLARGGDTRELSGWRAIARSNGGSAFVYARTADDAVRARRVLLGEAEASGLFRVVAAEELLRLGADPEAWFGLEARPGYHFVDDVGVALVARSALRGSGGYLPERSEMASGFVAWGRGVRAGVRIPWMRQIDVAPTVARLLGVELPEAEGRPVVGILNVPLTPELARRLPFRGGGEEDGKWRSSPAGQ
jgi:arylsulfatase A-like enzyme